MKRTITVLAAALLLMGVFTACGSRTDMDENVTPNIAPTATSVPRVTAAPTTAPTAMPKATTTPAAQNDAGQNGDNTNGAQKDDGANGGNNGADSDNILQDAGEDLEQAGDKLANDAGVIG